MHQENNQQNGSVWGTRFNWVANHINKLWTPKHNHTKHHVLEKMETKQIMSKIQNTKIEEQPKLNPKIQVLNRLRSQNFRHELQDKVKRVSAYFNRKQQSQDKPCDLVCPICLQFLIKPVTTVCGHNFCLRCLDQTLLFKTDCPSCRHHIRGTKLVESESLQKIVLRIITKYSEQQIELYEQYLTETQEWIKQRRLDAQDVQIDEIIDVKDTQYIWCKALIKEIYYSDEGRVESVLVHYLGWNTIYDEIIDARSERLCRGGLYTNRTQIPHYRSNTNEDSRMYSFVVNGTGESMDNLAMNIPMEMDFQLDMEGGIINPQANTELSEVSNHYYFTTEYYGNNGFGNGSNLQMIEEVEQHNEQRPQYDQQDQYDQEDQYEYNYGIGFGDMQYQLGLQSNNDSSLSQDISNRQQCQHEHGHGQQNGQIKVSVHSDAFHQNKQDSGENNQNGQQVQINHNNAQAATKIQAQMEIQIEQQLIQVGPFIFSINNDNNTATFLTSYSHHNPQEEQKQNTTQHSIHHTDGNTFGIGNPEENHHLLVYPINHKNINQHINQKQQENVNQNQDHGRNLSLI